MPMPSDRSSWPPLVYTDWQDSCATLHMWTQIVGKVRLALAPPVDQVFTAFRSRFLGKVSPVHFFWGSFDLAVTRFSGRLAPPPPSNPNIPDAINREAYSHEVSSCGFWPGNGGFGQAAFYSYAYPPP